MKVSDYVAQRLSILGIKRCFSVTGGGAMHLNDSFGQAKNIECTYLHHEQACSIAAEGYARIASKPAVVNVTSGPGAINALNGVFGAYTDSIPMIIVSGQVKVQTLLENSGEIQLRQFGDQEARSDAFIPTFVKSFKSLRSVKDVVTVIDEAFEVALSGRMGPCWIEIPVDIQGTTYEPLGRYLNNPITLKNKDGSIKFLDSHTLHEFGELLSSAQRPLFLCGSGVRLSDAQCDVVRLAESLSIPIVTAWTHDICDNNHPLFVGRPGTIGTRPGNFAVQSCDLLIVLGSRLNIRQVSYNWLTFANKAKIVMVDIDSAELCKSYLQVTLPIHSDVRAFVDQSGGYLRSNFPELYSSSRALERMNWISKLRTILEKYSPTKNDYPDPARGKGINPYHFIFSLNKYLGDKYNVVCGDATACIVPFQILSLSGNQRMFSNSGCASMGYDLPAGIGAGFASHDLDQYATTVILAGDGSLMMNIQELQSLSACSLDIVLFVLDNNGYLSIKQTQSNFFGREHGASPDSGVTFPDFARLAESFDLPVTVIEHYDDMDSKLKSLMVKKDRPRVCVVKLFEEQEFEPRLKSKIVNGLIQTPELDDMYPHLPSEELDEIRNYLVG